MSRALFLLALLPALATAQGYRPRSVSLLTYDGVQGQLLGQPLSADLMVLTHAAPGEDSLTMRELTYLRMAPTSVNNNARFRFDPDLGFTFSSAVLNAAGASFWTDSLVSRQGDRSVRVDQGQGLGFAPQSTIGTCDNTTGSGKHREGDVKVLSGASLSGRTRICMCTSDGGGTPAYAWLNVTTGTVGTSTACNN